MSRRRLFQVLNGAAAAVLSVVFVVQPAHAASPVVLTNTSTWKCADLPGTGAVPAGTPVAQYKCINSYDDNQQWTLVPTRTIGDTNYYEIVNVQSRQCLDLPGYRQVAATTRVSTYWCNWVPDNDNQEWGLGGARGRDGQYFIINYKSGLCLDVAGWVSDGSDQANEQPLTVFDCWRPGWGNDGADDHYWSLYAQLSVWSGDLCLVPA
ncbi:RICIN domain-containing protein [Streptomyces sp. SAS_270]|uniref:RICIN domain-containing protein n=1 Tax=Streptomyces sp. SAS_270 TaxID=3412748 RepID=UPI00403C8DB6